MAGSHLVVIVTTVSLLLVLLTATRCAGREFVVGDGGGWVERLGHESFNDWAKRQRFHVNDTLVFKYNAKGDGGVLWVTRGQYDACNTTGPLLSLGGGGDSRFVLKEPVEYYFIDADSNRCRIGERLIVQVQHYWHDNNNNTSSSPPPPKSSSSSQPPPTAPKPAPPPPESSSAPPPCPVPSFPGNVSSPSPAPVAAGTNGTDPPPSSKSSPVALRAGVLACLILGGAAILL
ncbi:hypothetical protein QOZ80_1AG0002830 [Eleusine coracana subsp. coracana]|nr:hypothetical protein QOZ80_1AG0002830 [Eleusine coracana subsp. coracana]